MNAVMPLQTNKYLFNLASTRARSSCFLYRPPFTIGESRSVINADHSKLPLVSCANSARTVLFFFLLNATNEFAQAFNVYSLCFRFPSIRSALHVRRQWLIGGRDHDLWQKSRVHCYLESIRIRQLYTSNTCFVYWSS